MKKLMEKWKKWLSKKPVWWSIPLGFICTFALGVLLITCLAIITSMLHWAGFDSQLGLFIDSRYSTSDFYSSIDIFAVKIIGSILLLITITSIILETKHQNTINRNSKKNYNPFLISEVFWLKEEEEGQEEEEENHQRFIEKYIDTPVKKFIAWGRTLLYSPSFIISVCIVVIAFLIYFWNDISCTFGISNSSNCKFTNINDNPKDIYRNRILVFAALITFFLTVWGRWLTQRQTKHTQEQLEQGQKQLELSRKANANERYEKATHMLGNSVLAVRIAGFHALRSLGIENEKMALQCIQLCLLFISTPYFSEEEIAITAGLSEEAKLEKIFPANEKLRLDIEAAIIAFSGICQHYYTEGKILKLGEVDLPSYFWNNRKKGTISLPNSKIIDFKLRNASFAKANLAGIEAEEIDLQRVNLNYANLSNADFEEANLKEINFSHAKLSRMNLEDAELREVDLSYANLKKVILMDAYLNNVSLHYANLYKANLIRVNLSNADLYSANLSKANLSGGELSEVNLAYVNLSGVDLSEVKMSTARNLEKEQILSATWGYTGIGIEQETYPPELPNDLLNDKEIQEWLKNENYHKYKKT